MVLVNIVGAQVGHHGVCIIVALDLQLVVFFYHSRILDWLTSPFFSRKRNTFFIDYILYVLSFANCIGHYDKSVKS